ncbi:MAG TPA: hypothetical protein VM509_12965, partial [Planctomycetota bacterium]|nr:hypothetical protein [Planctomycetota bacterium]
MTASASKPGGRLARVTRWIAAVAVASFVLLEVAARAFTHDGGNGMPCVGRVALLPLRPEPELVERSLARSAGSTYVVRDPELGWTIGPNGESNGGGSELLYRSNAQGIRADPSRTYADAVPVGKVRIVTVGDSFTHGDEVENQDTWQRRLEEGRPDLEVLNLGVPGYGTDQALLRWRRDGSRFQSQFVILGIWPENMCRNLGCFRYYLVPTESFACKPRMLVEDGALRVINSPVLQGEALAATLAEPESHPLLANDFWYRARETRPKAFQSVRVFRVAESVLSALERKRERMRLYTGANPKGIDITVAIARQFADDVRAAGATPIVLLIPMRDLLGM